MTRLLGTLLLLLAPLSISAQVVTLPQAVSGQPGIPIPVVAVADGKNVVWVTPDKGLVVIDGAFFGGDSKKAMLFGPQGMYRLWAFTAKGDTVSINAECIVTIGTPTPPVPPGPTPTDPFTRAVADAYATESVATRATDAASWAAAFQATAGKVDTFSTYADLHAALKTELAKTRPGALPRVKAVLTAEIQNAFGVQSTAAIDRTATRNELTKIATALQFLKGVK